MVSPRARTIRCSGCGSATEVDSLLEHYTCSHCGQLQQVDLALVTELEEHRRGIQQTVDAATWAEERASQ
jgi:DNA-directed RNA polymerase subunit RPC12/RpoP